MGPVPTRADSISQAFSGYCAAERALLMRLDERPPAVDGDDHPTLAEYLHSTADGRVSHSIVFREAALTRELRCDLAFGDPALYVVSYLDIGVFRTIGINWPGNHKITIECLLTCVNVR